MNRDARAAAFKNLMPSEGSPESTRSHTLRARLLLGLIRRLTSLCAAALRTCLFTPILIEQQLQRGSDPAAQCIRARSRNAPTTRERSRLLALATREPSAMVCQLPEDAAREVVRACGLRELGRFSCASQMGASLASSGFEAIGRRRYPGLAVLAEGAQEQDWRALCRRARSIYRPLEMPRSLQPLDRQTALIRINNQFQFVAEAFDGDPSDATTTCLGAALFSMVVFTHPQRGEMTAVGGAFPGLRNAKERIHFLRLQVARKADQTYALLYTGARTRGFRGPNHIPFDNFLTNCAPWIQLSSIDQDYPNWVMAQIEDESHDETAGTVLFTFTNRADGIPYFPEAFEEVLLRIEHMLSYE
mmetsp:Transcript_33061/g.99610  ORF Transcript_33061/g.99610 Transcript_33061/m.99610 type:complete len:360 (-) Transcript_33061:21-1100(-)